MEQPGFDRRTVAALALALALAIWLALVHFAGSVLEQIEERTTDFVWSATADRSQERRLIIVDIDERSIAEIGPWPWPRPTMARLVQRIAEMGGGQQIHDLVYVEPRAGDELLATAFKTTQPVQAQVFALDQGDAAVQRGRLAGAFDWVACPAPFEEASGYLANANELRATNAGHITPRVGPDGTVRHQPAVVCFDNRAYPALAIVAVMKGAGGGAIELLKGERWLDPPLRLAGPGLPFGSIPLDARGDMRVPWRQHPESFLSLSAADLLNGRVPTKIWQNAWVLVGSTAFGLNDTIATPFRGAAAGLQVHAELLTALIDGRLPSVPLFAPWYRAAAAALGAGLLLAWYLRRRRALFYMAPIAALGWAGGLYALHGNVLVLHSLWLGWVEPALFVLLAGGSLSGLEHARNRFERDRLYSHLASYLPAPVAAALALQPPSSQIKARRQHISVLFADIRNFSAYCEARPPEEAAAVLHAFFSTATQIVEATGGVIDAFQGDAAIAVWNGDPAGESDGDHAERSLEAAVKLLAAVKPILPDPAPEGLEPLALGIGIETGPAMVGSFGLARRRTHMALGPAVTIANRLVDMTSELAHPILVGEGLAAHIKDSPLDSMGIFLLEGLKTPHHIYAYPLASLEKSL